MKIVSTSYSKTQEFSSPQDWLERISFYTGILEESAKTNEVISIERIDYEGEYNKNGVHYKFIRLKNRVTRFPFRLHNYIKNQKPDIVLVNGFIFPLQIIQLRLAVGSKPKIIVLHRAEKPGTGLKKILQQAADNCVDAYLFVSHEFGKHWIEKGVIRNAKKIYEVMQASSSFHLQNKNAARTTLGLKNSSVYLWVGRLEKNKDPLTVVKGFIEFSSVHPSVQLYMIYQTEELIAEVRSLIQQSGKTDHIFLLGKKEHAQLSLWYNSADFLISGSHYEGSGIAVIEAMSVGCIPIVTNIVSFRKLTADNCGLVYTAGDERDLVNVLQHSLRIDKEVYRKRIIQRFEREYSFKAISDKIQTIAAELTHV